MTAPAITLFVCGDVDGVPLEALDAACLGEPDDPDACPHCGAEGEREGDYAWLCGGCGRPLYE